MKGIEKRVTGPEAFMLFGEVWVRDNGPPLRGLTKTEAEEILRRARQAGWVAAQEWRAGCASQ